jgi:hypothetical protein
MKNKFLSILALITFPILTVGAKAETTPGSATLLIPVTNPIVVDGVVVGNTTLPAGTTVSVTGTVPNGVLINGSTNPAPLSAIAPEEIANALATSKQVVLAKDYKGVLKGTSIPIDYVSVYGSIHFSGDRDDSGKKVNFSPQTGIGQEVFTPDSVSRIEALAKTTRPMPTLYHIPGKIVSSATTKAEVESGLDLHKAILNTPRNMSPRADGYANTFQHNPVSFTNDFVALQVPTEKQENKYDASSVVAIANALNYLFTKKEGHPVEVSRAFLTWAHDMNKYSDSELASNTIIWNQSEWINPPVDFEGVLDMVPEDLERNKRVREDELTRLIPMYEKGIADYKAHYLEHPEDKEDIIPDPKRPNHYKSAKTGAYVYTLEEQEGALAKTKALYSSAGLFTNIVIGDHRTAGVGDSLQALLRFGVCEESLMPHASLEGTNYPSKEALITASTKKNFVVRCFNSLEDTNAQLTQASLKEKEEMRENDQNIKDPNKSWEMADSIMNRTLFFEARRAAFVARELDAGRVVIVTAYIPHAPIISDDDMTKIMKVKDGRLPTITEAVNPTLNGYGTGAAKFYPQTWEDGEKFEVINNKHITPPEGKIELSTFVIIGMHKNLTFDFLTPFGKEFGNNGVDTTPWAMPWVGLKHPELRTEIYSIGFE